MQLLVKQSHFHVVTFFVSIVGSSTLELLKKASLFGSFSYMDFFQLWSVFYTFLIPLVETKNMMHKFDPNLVKINRKQPKRLCQKATIKLAQTHPKFLGLVLLIPE